jgi:phosphotriesterase-related protein
MTVNGPVSPEEIGITLVHEHLYMEFAGFGSDPTTPERKIDWASAAEARWDTNAFPASGRFTNVDLTISELGYYTASGGRTVVDQTPVVLSRDPLVLREISNRTGLHVVMGGGYFTEPFHDERTRARSADELAQEFLSEIRDGVGDTGIRPGIMGEIGTGDPFTDRERDLLRAYAWVQLESGLAMSIHQQALGRYAPEVVDILTAEGVPPDRISLCHMSPTIDDEAYQLALFDRGVYLAFDYLGLDHAVYFPGRYMPNDYDVADAIAKYVKRGLTSRILLSHDIGELIRLRVYAGWGFAHVLDHIVPLLRRLGVSEAEVGTMLVTNPAELLTVAPRSEA